MKPPVAIPVRHMCLPASTTAHKPPYRRMDSPVLRLREGARLAEVDGATPALHAAASAARARIAVVFVTHVPSQPRLCRLHGGCGGSVSMRSILVLERPR
jgi:hypothetical protein